MLYHSVVIPVFQEGKGSKAQIMKAFYAACDFIEKLDVPTTFTRITTEWLISGVYYGILRESEGKYVVQDLPLPYCRTRFRDFYGLNVLEFNINYFNQFTNERERNEILSTYPEEIQKAWNSWFKKPKKNRDDDSPWVILPAGSGGICFSFSSDQIPLLISSISDVQDLDDSTKREAKRDENELYKLLIQRMPIDSSGELVFPLEEVADIHASVADMLANEDTVEVLTTFGETNLESLQDSSSASQSNDRISKYRQNVWNALGRGEILFNPNNSSSLSYQIKKDEALMQSFLNVYNTWVKFHLNDKFARKDLTFDFKILPLTVFNLQEAQQAYFRGAQYGYSKMFAGVAMGIKQIDQLSLINFENDFLQMSSKMIPLQSSYTTPGGTISSEGKNLAETDVKKSQTNDIENTGGRPELPDDQKSEKTLSNRENLV